MIFCFIKACKCVNNKNNKKKHTLQLFLSAIKECKCLESQRLSQYKRSIVEYLHFPYLVQKVNMNSILVAVSLKHVSCPGFNSSINSIKKSSIRWIRQIYDLQLFNISPSYICITLKRALSLKRVRFPVTCQHDVTDLHFLMQKYANACNCVNA